MTPGTAPGVQFQTDGDRPKIKIDLQSEFAKKYQFDNKKTFLKQQSHSNEIEIEEKVRLPGPLPEPDQQQLQAQESHLRIETGMDLTNPPPKNSY